MPEERRKKWLLGIAREGWAAIVLAVLSTVFGYGMLTNRVSGNEDNLKTWKADSIKAYDDLKADFRQQITQVREEQQKNFDRVILLIKANK